MPRNTPEPTLVTPQVLRSWQLPEPSGGKNERGSILVIGGSTETLGAVLLAAEGAMRAGAGKLQVATVASRAVIDHPPPEFRDAPQWRVHFHVPVDADRIGPLATTRPDLRDALAAVAKLDYAPHLEVETYTWDVMPGRQQVDLADALAREIRAARVMLDAQPA